MGLLQFLRLLEKSRSIPLWKQGSALLGVIARTGVILAQEADCVSPAERFGERAESAIPQLALIGDQCFHCG